MCSFVLSLACAYLPLVSTLTEGTRIIILTVVISTVAAILFPVKDKEVAEDES